LDAVMDAGCGLGIACSMPSLGMGNEKHELGLAVASAPAATTTPVLRYARVLTRPLELLYFNEIPV
jgi:BASS family bile acid:Na+ symporter